MKALVAGLMAVAFAAPVVAAELPAGNWRLAQLGSATAETRIGVIKLETKDGKPTATVLDTLTFPPQKKGEEPEKLDMKAVGVALDGTSIRLNVEVNGNPQAFEGTVDPKDPNVVRGTYGDDRRVSRGTLIKQDGDKLIPLNPKDGPEPPEPCAKAIKLRNAPLILRARAQRSKDIDEKADLLDQAKAAQKEADEKVPGLFRETVEKHADSPHAIDTANLLIRSAAKWKATVQEVEDWYQLIEKDATRYGPRLVAEAAVQAAESLRSQKGLEAAALVAADRANALVKETYPTAFQERGLRAVKSILAACGKADHARAVETRLGKLAAALDQEFAAKVPPFNPDSFPGRKDGKANRAVVMELFTGTQCPPCIAADVAFDALGKAYKPADLVLIQYHLHIPGPDPLTNADTVVRYDQYKKRFPNNVGGTPSVLFNGKPFGFYDKERTHQGGGSMENSKNKFDHFRAIIDPLLEEKSTVRLMGTATRDRDKINVAVQVEGVKDAPEAVLRLLLVEEEVRYVGGNGLRVHHQVVRDFFGTVAGLPVAKLAGKTTREVDLAALRKDLTAYLDKYDAEEPFPYDDRPMDLARLKVIALVQDDDTGEILNATQLDVTGK